MHTPLGFEHILDTNCEESNLRSFPEYEYIFSSPNLNSSLTTGLPDFSYYPKTNMTGWWNSTMNESMLISYLF